MSAPPSISTSATSASSLLAAQCRAVSLPGSVDEPWVAAFAAGLGDDAKTYECPLLGGDTDRTPGPASVSITAFGTVPHGAMVRRSTAQVGDCVVVTGTIGDSALGVRLRPLCVMPGLGPGTHDCPS